MKKKLTEGVKYDADKPRYDLLSAVAVHQLVLVLTFGAAKYEDHNWRKGIVMSRLIAASLRHLFAIIRGEDIDKETGLLHSAHLMCNAMFMTEQIIMRPKFDDRWLPSVNEAKEAHRYLTLAERIHERETSSKS